MFRTYFTSSFSGLPGTIVFRGYIDCSGDPNYPAAISGDMYVVSVAGRIGGASGIIVEVGDQITCITDNAGGTQIAVGNDFSIAQANITYVPENAALKDTANGYPGLSTFKINFLNFLGTFTSYFQNTNTASRLYSFQDRDGTIADNTDLALKVDTNASITGATKTKITYDTKGLVTAGADATTADINDSLNRRYVTDANLTVINNTSGVNTGNETTQTIGNLINSANSKTTPVDADQLGLMDSATGNILTKLSWANVKATLKTYFDTLYSAIGASFYIGTTLIANNRASAGQTLTGVSIDGNAATVTTNANLTGNVTSVGNATTIEAGVVTEAMQVLADNTTQDVSATKHGYAPKAPNDATKFLDGTGAWSTPSAPTYYSYNKISLSFSGATLTYSGETNVSGVLVRPSSTINITGAAGWRYVVCDNAGTVTIEIIPVAEITTNSTKYTPFPTFNTTYYGYYSSVNTTKRIIGIAYFDATNILEAIPYGNGTVKNDDLWQSNGDGDITSGVNERLQFTDAFTYARGTNITCVDNGAGTTDNDGLRITFNKSGNAKIRIVFNTNANTDLQISVNKNSVFVEDLFFTGSNVTFQTPYTLDIPVTANDYFTFYISFTTPASTTFLQKPIITFEEY